MFCFVCLFSVGLRMRTYLVSHYLFAFGLYFVVALLFIVFGLIMQVSFLSLFLSLWLYCLCCSVFLVHWLLVVFVLRSESWFDLYVLMLVCSVTVLPGNTHAHYRNPAAGMGSCDRAVVYVYVSAVFNDTHIELGDVSYRHPERHFLYVARLCCLFLVTLSILYSFSVSIVIVVC